MAFKVTTRVMELVEQLIQEGYEGDATITNDYCTGTKEVLGNAISVQLSGFSKECLYLVEDTETGDIVAVGRYNLEYREPEYSVQAIVAKAYEFYQYSKDRGYRLPDAFKNLFVKYGHIVKKTKTTEVWEEK